MSLLLSCFSVKYFDRIRRFAKDEKEGVLSLIVYILHPVIRPGGSFNRHRRGQILNGATRNTSKLKTR